MIKMDTRVLILQGEMDILLQKPKNTGKKVYVFHYSDSSLKTGDVRSHLHHLSWCFDTPH